MRFNKKASTPIKTINLAGGQAYSEDPKLEFVSILLTSFVKDQFYRSAKDGMDRVKFLMAAIRDKKFLAKAAIYARTKFGMRSVSHVVAGELVPLARGEDWLKDFYNKIVYRPDDMAEILAYYLGEYGKPVPNSIKKGFASAINRFDAYQLAKYRGERSELSLVDIVNLIHVKPNAKTRLAIKKLMEGELKSKDTWEKNLTQAGQEVSEIEDADEKAEKLAELKGAAWTKLIKSKKLGYFALLRNLRNIINDAPEALDEALEMLTDKDLIKGSLVMPFRYLTALDELEKLGSKEARQAIKALNKAVDISCSNVPRFDGETLVAVDISGSMSGKVADNAGLFAAILAKSNDADVIQFSDNASYKSINTSDSVLTLAKQLRGSTGGTNFHSIFTTANKKYDRVVILSDMQGWIGQYAPTSTFNAYKKKYHADSKIYSFDLQGYGTLQFPQSGVYCLAGFSEKVFDVMKLLETDRQAMVREIEKVQL